MKHTCAIVPVSLVLCLAAMLLSACNETPQGSVGSIERTPLPLPPTRTADSQPTPDESDTSPELGVLTEPVSGKVQLGQAYIFAIYTHCGLDQRVDFDGSFWIAADPSLREFGNAPAGVGNPVQSGVMTLIDTNLARFEYDGGQFDFIRHEGPKRIRGCY